MDHHFSLVLYRAFLFEQLKKGEVINKKEKKFLKFIIFFSKIAKNYNIRIPYIEDYIDVNGHFYWILIPKKLEISFKNSENQYN